MGKSRLRDRQSRGKKGRKAGTDSGLFDADPLLRSPRARRSEKPLEAQTPAQQSYINAILSSQLVFGVGPAGTGKTFVAAALAAEALLAGEVERILISRPAVEAGGGLGFLPGELEEKFDPYFAPIREILNERVGQGYTEALIKAGKIVVCPLEFMRGHTFKNAWVILDEAQNTTKTQMKLFLTRIGDNTKVIVNGDLQQKDIEGPSGLKDAIERLDGVGGIEVVSFAREDIVRSGLVREIVERYNNDHESSTSGFGDDTPGFIRTTPRLPPLKGFG